MPSFEEWLDVVFDHPVGGPEWCWSKDFDTIWTALGLTDALTVEHLTRLRKKLACQGRDTLDQVGQERCF